MADPSDDCGCNQPGFNAEVSRRTFVTIGALGLASLGAGRHAAAFAGPFTTQDTRDHFVPADKKLSPDWVQQLFERGEPTWYEGNDLATIGMPVGGICAGQVYLSGDGRLIYWGIFNQNINTGYGAVNYQAGRLPTMMVTNPDQFIATPAIDQGFAVRVASNGQTETRRLDAQGFPGTRFKGEYPIGRVEYRDKAFPIEVALEAFSPFVPLDPDASSLPATLLQYELTNRSDAPATVTLAGWLANGVAPYSGEYLSPFIERVNTVEERPGVTAIVCSARRKADEAVAVREPRLLADFEAGGYGAWTATGQAFGVQPARGTLDRQQDVSGFQGLGLVNSFLGGDAPQGTLTSPEFTIDRRFLCFLIGGGNIPGRTCINLLVDGQVVRTATGPSRERLRPEHWNLDDLAGQSARLQIVDVESGPWGHVNVDQIELRDMPPQLDAESIETKADWGTMALALLDAPAHGAWTAIPAGELPAALFEAPTNRASEPAVASGEAPGPLGALASRFTLEPGQTRTVTFCVTWCFPHMSRGDQAVQNRYATRFQTAGDVAAHLGANLTGLAATTRLWHRTFYESSLPHWLLERLHSTVANLATETCQWWGNGRFWGWEGCGCCHGTCGHVWNYEHAMARLFPALERSVREMQDFTPEGGFIPETGEIRFRGEGWNLWAGDAQGGYILKAYREHQVSADGAFLKRNWPRIKQAAQFLLDQDGDGDGLIEGAQHQTYDQNYFGANTFVGALYLGALRAAEEMARLQGDDAFATRCRTVFEAGSRHSVERLFNGAYFIQDVDLAAHPADQYADGCLADQVFGQAWAHQVGLGDLYPRETVRQALQSIWTYCWAPDVKRQNEAHRPERWFAYPGEAGLFICTWPRGSHLGPSSTRYRDEVWTGIEYQVAGHMVHEGMLTEALAICRAIHERYHPSKRNPFNEIECGDHYARSMASWGVFLELAGFEYDGPRGHLGFAPRLAPERFDCAFTAAQGWGTLRQRREASRQVNHVAVTWGELTLHTLALELAPEAQARRVSSSQVDGPVAFEQTGRRLLIRLPEPLVIPAGQDLEVVIAM